ncbi:uncharacterized protein LOC123511455 isoform X2 [Portunus trituberculatus]|uniref:uncharacterized protein LOC123511455 isoform X2 n=1 Tax=Portunus trituberculatus TaxID=210409 RepID=UPI001E1D207C|nr:uncharacterized protein LOC123511455 isoform X2 [Portunus trituberculatus]
MLKSLFLVAVVLSGSVTAADGIKEQDQIYIVSGVLGGVCLLLTIAAIYNAMTIIKLQTKLTVLQAANAASNKTIVEAPRTQQPMPRGEELNRYQQEEHFRAPPPRENYRMDRFNPENYFETNHYVHGGPVPPPRPQRVGPSARDNYY